MTLRVKVQLDCRMRLLPAPEPAPGTPCALQVLASPHLCEQVLLHNPLKFTRERGDSVLLSSSGPHVLRP